MASASSVLDKAGYQEKEGEIKKSKQKKRRQLSAGEVRGRWRNTEVEVPLDARLSFVVLVREDAEELPAKPRVVDPQHDPGHVDNPQGTWEIVAVPPDYHWCCRKLWTARKARRPNNSSFGWERTDQVRAATSLSWRILLCNFFVGALQWLWWW